MTLYEKIFKKLKTHGGFLVWRCAITGFVSTLILMILTTHTSFKYSMIIKLKDAVKDLKLVFIQVTEDLSKKATKKV